MIQAAVTGCFFHTPGKAQTGLDRDGFRSQLEGFGRSKATWEAKKNFQATSLSDDLDYMVSLVPEFEETQKVKAIETDLRIKRVKKQPVFPLGRKLTGQKERSDFHHGTLYASNPTYLVGRF